MSDISPAELVGETCVKGADRPAFLNKIQPKTTLTGFPIREVPWTLPYWTESLCPECREIIKARKFAEGGKVFMEKECVEHGHFKELISPDVNFYMRLFTHRYGDGRGLLNPLVTSGRKCPTDCGICNMHHSHACMVNIDLTELSYEKVSSLMKILRERKPVPVKAVHFAGGEAMHHPRFIDIIKRAKEFGFGHIQIAHNGENLSDINFARTVREAGLDSVCLKFDGVTRAEEVLNVCRQAGLRVVLVPTIIRGVNDDQVGAIVKFACENSDVITGILFQPDRFTGRMSEKDRLAKRYTITHLAKDIADQTNNMMPLENWFPFGVTQPLSRLSKAISGRPAFFVSCHPDCGAGGYLFIEPNKRKEVKALTEFFNLEGAMREIQASYFSDTGALRILKKYLNKSKAPKGLTLRRMLGVMDGYGDTKRGYNTIFIAGMHFQDVYNYDIERVKRCVIHHIAQDGKMYPFCALKNPGRAVSDF